MSTGLSGRALLHDAEVVLLVRGRLGRWFGPSFSIAYRAVTDIAI